MRFQRLSPDWRSFVLGLSFGGLVSPRADLPGPHGGAFGGIDGRVIKISSMQAVLPPTAGKPPEVEAQAGPSHDQQGEI